MHDAALLQEVRLDLGAADVVAGADVDLDELAKAAAVVVAQRLGVAKGFQNGVGLKRREKEHSKGTGGASKDRGLRMQWS